MKTIITNTLWRIQKWVDKESFLDHTNNNFTNYHNNIISKCDQEYPMKLHNLYSDHSLTPEG